MIGERVALLGVCCGVALLGVCCGVVAGERDGLLGVLVCDVDGVIEMVVFCGDVVCVCVVGNGSDVFVGFVKLDGGRILGILDVLNIGCGVMKLY